jgi:hypothetical protein
MIEISINPATGDLSPEKAEDHQNIGAYNLDLMNTIFFTTIALRTFYSSHEKFQDIPDLPFRHYFFLRHQARHR